MEMANVLVVDDELFIVNSVTALLQCQTDWNLNVHCAHSGEEALDTIQSVRIDILITDIHMPGMSGLELARRTQELWPECVRLLLTAYEDFSFAYEAIQMGMDFFVLKTESDERLLEKFGRAVQLFVERRERALERLPAGTDCSNLNAQLLSLLLTIPQDENQTRSILGMMGSELNELWLLTVDVPQGAPAGTMEWLIRDQTARRAKTIAVNCQDNRLCMLLQPSAQVSSLRGALELAQAHYADAFSAEVSIVIGLVSSCAWNVRAEFERAKALLASGNGELTGFIYLMPAPHQAEQELHSLFDKLIQYIGEHIHEDLSLNTLSDMVGYSPTYLSRLFHERIGQSLSMYISQEKMRRVRELMHDPKLSVNDIALALGFNSRSYFNRYVKRMTGYNPQQLREKLLGENQS